MVEFFPSREVVLVAGYFTVRWYGLLYVLAFWLGTWLLPQVARRSGLLLSRQTATAVAAWVALGVIIGGRMGYVLLYEPLYYVTHLVEIFWLAHGGMSFHGGFIGVGVALWLVAKKMKLSFWQLADVLVVPVAVGLALGRLGNFINQELYVGSWALAVAAADAVLGLLCWYLLLSKPGFESRALTRNGGVTGVFLVGYAMIRFLNEFVRIQEFPPVFGTVTYGQVLTIPIFLLGVWLIWINSRKVKRWQTG